MKANEYAAKSNMSKLENSAVDNSPRLQHAYVCSTTYTFHTPRIWIIVS